MEEQKPAEVDKVGLRELIKLSAWVISLFVKISPVKAVIYITTEAVSELNTIFVSAIFASIIDGLIDAVQNGGNYQHVYLMLTVMGGYQALLAVVRGLNSFSARTIRYESDWFIDMYQAKEIARLGVQTLEQPDVSNLIQRANQAMYGLDEYVSRLTRLISGFFAIIIAGVLIFTYAPIFILVAVLATIIKYFPNRAHMRRSYTYYFETSEERRKAGWTTDVLRDPVRVKEILFTNAIPYFQVFYESIAKRYLKTSEEIFTRWEYSKFGFALIDVFVSVASYIYVLVRVANGLVSVGSMLFQVRIIEEFTTRMADILSRFLALQEWSLRMNDAYQLFHIEPLEKDGPIKLPIFITPPAIEIKDLIFHYPDSERNIFSDLNLTINAGERVAIVGHNGAGKTTLVKLLARMYAPNQGNVFIDGKNLADLQLETWHNNLGILFQDYNIYGHLTVRENIGIGDVSRGIDPLRVTEAAKRADADGFIQDFPLKYEQVLSERFTNGTRLSTGQAQKIAIARLFYRNPAVVVFDEPTASIDAESEFRIFNQIYDFFLNKTVIIISHRFSTVRNADRIIVLDRGKIVEQGSHAELIKLNQYYAHAFNLQAQGYQSDNYR